MSVSCIENDQLLTHKGSLTPVPFEQHAIGRCMAKFSDHRIICISSLYWGHPNFRAHWLITEPSFSIFIFVMNIAVIGILFMLNQSPINWIGSLVSIIYNVCFKTVYILDRIICLLCVYICHYIFPFYYLDIFFFFFFLNNQGYR
jgi:hypothetical protein